MNKFIVFLAIFMFGILFGVILTEIKVFESFNFDKNLYQKTSEMQIDYYTNGFDTGYERGDRDGFRRCYDNRQDFPFYTSKESSAF
jgi:hypothetical protein